MNYFRKKVLHLVPVFFLVTFSSFLLLSLLPGDLVEAILIDESSTVPSEEIRQALAKELNLDKPVLVRYGIWLGNLFQGDWGRSYITTESVTDALAQRIPVSLQLMLMSQIIAVFVAVPLALFSAYRAGSPIDKVISSVAFGVLSMPVFVIAVILIYIFAIQLDVLPSSGYTPIQENFLKNIESFILPALTIALIETPVLMRVLRTDMISTLQEDFISLAKAKGMSTGYILFHHALRPSSFTFVTVLGLQVGNMITGAVITETVFSVPGVGKLLIESVDARDEIMVQGVVTFIAIVYIIVNIAVDILYAVLDPRVMQRA